MIELTNNEKVFLKSLKKMTQANDDDVKNIYLMYRKLINKPEVVDEYKSCNCPSLIRDMHFEIVLWTLKNKSMLR